VISWILGYLGGLRFLLWLNLKLGVKIKGF